MYQKIIFQKKIVINSLLLLFLISTFSFANDNIRYQDKYIKKMSKKNSCYFHIEINGNTDWNRKKKELNTILKNRDANKCFKITIYKKIKNVHVRNESNSNEKLYTLNIGTILKGYSGDIEVYTEVVNSNISTGYLKPAPANAGIIKHKDQFGNGMQDISNNVKFNNSQIGSDFFK